MSKFASQRDKVLWHLWQRGFATREGGEIGSRSGGFATVHISTPTEVAKAEATCGELLARVQLPVEKIVGHFVVSEDHYGRCHVYDFERGYQADDEFDDRQRTHRLRTNPGYRLREFPTAA
jgi:hypothetical protein